MFPKQIGLWSRVVITKCKTIEVLLFVLFLHIRSLSCKMGKNNWARRLFWSSLVHGSMIGFFRNRIQNSISVDIIIVDLRKMRDWVNFVPANGIKKLQLCEINFFFWIRDMKIIVECRSEYYNSVNVILKVIIWYYGYQ